MLNYECIMYLVNNVSVFQLAILRLLCTHYALDFERERKDICYCFNVVRLFRAYNYWMFVVLVRFLLKS